MHLFHVVLTHPDLPERREVTCQADHRRHAVAIAAEQDRKLSEEKNTPRYELSSVTRLDRRRLWSRIFGSRRGDHR
jgi:hypothetical protein